MTAQVSNQHGRISFDDTVVANLACKVAMSTYGIVGLAAKNTKEGIYELLGMENMTRGVQVENLDGNHIRIQIQVIVEYGTRINLVCGNLIEAVKYEVEENTGLVVDSVDVIIEGIQA
jgi:uncharacterized alkaline shock family protein YloU